MATQHDSKQAEVVWYVLLSFWLWVSLCVLSVSDRQVRTDKCSEGKVQVMAECRWMCSRSNMSDYGNFAPVEQVWLTSSRPGSKAMNWNARSQQGYVNWTLKPYISLLLWHLHPLTLPFCFYLCLCRTHLCAVAGKSNSQFAGLNLLFCWVPLMYNDTSCYY